MEINRGIIKIINIIESVHNVNETKFPNFYYADDSIDLSFSWQVFLIALKVENCTQDNCKGNLNILH